MLSGLEFRVIIMFLLWTSWGQALKTFSAFAEKAVLKNCFVAC
jgi:hypothetical protein